MVLFLHLLFFLVARFILCLLSDLILIQFSLVSLLDSLLLVLYRFMQRSDSFLTFLLVTLQILHKVVETETTLKLFLSLLDLLAGLIVTD